jgi:hypothetical protein
MPDPPLSGEAVDLEAGVDRVDRVDRVDVDAVAARLDVDAVAWTSAASEPRGRTPTTPCPMVDRLLQRGGRGRSGPAQSPT